MVLILSTTSVLTATFSWFVAQRRAQATLSTISIEKEMTVNFRWFKYNSADGKVNPNGDDFTDLKLSGYTRADSTKNPVSVTNYNEDFILCDISKASNAFAMEEVFPDIRYTFALEITSNFQNPTSIGLELSNFIPGESLDSFARDPNALKGAPGNPICLAEALDFYTRVFDQADLTTQNINEFILDCENLETLPEPNPDGKKLNPDKFKFTNENKITSAQLVDGVLFNPGETKYFFFTIEFSDDPSTYYAFDHIEGTAPNNKYFFHKDPVIGTSNAYQALTFEIKKLVVRRM